MTAKVLGLDGQPSIAAREVDEQLVAGLEELLEQAKSGEVQGVAYAATFWDKTASGRTLGVANVTTVGRLSGMASVLYMDIIKAASE